MLTEQSSGSSTCAVQQQNKKSRLNSLISFQNNLGANEYRKDRRVHGLQLPLHPLQLVGWVTFIVFILAAYLVIIPVFPSFVQLPLYSILSLLVIIHICAHVTALLIDPADIELKKISTRKVVPEFDRSKHLHVIENGRCHLCNIKTSSTRTKHCSVCNKCIGKFDHHCKYLNQCVGSRNYAAFLMCVVSAVTAVLVILAAALAQIVLFYVNPGFLNLWDRSFIASTTLNQTKNLTSDDELTTTTFLQFLNGTFVNDTLGDNATQTHISEVKVSEGIGLYNTIFLSVISIIVILSAITAGLLLHLCFFHVYISYLGFTTYEYIRNHRLAASNANGPSTIESNKSLAHEIYACSNIKVLDNKHRPKTLHCCNIDNVAKSGSVGTSSEISQKAFYLCTVLEESRATTNEFSSSNNSVEDSTRTFHCCSEFSQTTQTLNGSQKILFTEQCTFCSFRIKTPQKIDHTNKRCCVKAITKHHRWRRKWNCCSNVSNSPDDLPNDTLRSMSGTNVSFTPAVATEEIQVRPTQSQHRYVQIEVPIENGANESSEFYANSLVESKSELVISNPPEISNNILRTNEATTAACSNDSGAIKTISQINNSAMKRTRSKLIRPWPVRIRHMFRMINRYRRPRCRGVHSLKQNQIRPLPVTCSNSSELAEVESASAPSAPPPSRRKINNSTDLQELADTLSIIQTSSGILVPPNQQSRRQRRKNILRNRSPTLSPIIESGFSNPTSPQLACRQSCTGSITSLNSSICGNVVSKAKPNK